MKDARRDVHAIAADAIGDDASSSILPSSTGIIGHLLPMERVERGIRECATQLGDSREHAEQFMEAILTTDLVRKEASAKVKIGRQTVTISRRLQGQRHDRPAPRHRARRAACKIRRGCRVCTRRCSRTLRPTSEAQARPRCESCCCRPRNRSFNSVTVDDHTSTNDTLADPRQRRLGCLRSPRRARRLKKFASALDEVCVSLAKQIAADGEGATKLVSVTVRGAQQLGRREQDGACDRQQSAREVRAQRQRPELGPNRQRGRHVRRDVRSGSGRAEACRERASSSRGTPLDVRRRQRQRRDERQNARHRPDLQRRRRPRNRSTRATSRRST